MNNTPNNNDLSSIPPSGGGGATPFDGAAFPGQIHETPGGGIVLSKLDDVINWARSNSLWPLTFATSCCGIEYMAVAGAKYDFSSSKSLATAGRCHHYCWHHR